MPSYSESKTWLTENVETPSSSARAATEAATHTLPSLSASALISLGSIGSEYGSNL